MVRMRSLLAVTALLFSTTFAISTTTAAGFVSNDGSIGFTLNVPEEQEQADKLYFVLTAPGGASWVAVGMGNKKMENTLMFIMYFDSTGKNITVSPRLSYGHTEPSYTSNVTYSVLPGSGVFNGKMVANVMCGNCRQWKGGSIDPTNAAANFIYAVGTNQNFKSDSPSAGLMRHTAFGTFTMDLTKAVGAGQIPIAVTADTSGTTQYLDKGDHDFPAAFHAFFMILAFFGLMPLGVVILRVLKSPKWHGFNQILSVTVAMGGVFLGFYSSTMYNRSKHFNSAHQVIGLLIIVAMISQAVIGFMHHRIYLATQAPTKLAPIHVWLGRVLIVAGIANAFVGFQFALNGKYDWAALALFLLLTIILGPLFFWRYRHNISKARKTGFAAQDGSTGYQAQPWNTDAGQSDINLHNMNSPPYHPPQQNERQFV